MNATQQDIEPMYRRFMRAYAAERLARGDELFVAPRDFRAIALHFYNLGLEKAAPVDRVDRRIDKWMEAHS